MPADLEVDTVVVGSGPAGATTARVAAENGARVLLVEKKQELGAPVQCSGAVSSHALAEAGVPVNDEFVSTPIHGFVTYESTGESVTVDYRGERDEALGYVVDRRRFDRYLMTMAERQDVTVWLKTEARGYARRPDGNVDVNLSRFGEPVTVRARVIVGADGLQSQVGKWAGLRTHIRLAELASCLQYVVDGVETNGLLEIVTGHRWAPGGYAWLFPKGHGYAEVGLGVARTMTKDDARTHLKRFMRDSFLADRLADARILEIQGGGVPLAAPLKRQVADNVLLVGDAARHVNPITGGGIHTALRGGLIAGRTLAKLISERIQPTAENLSRYHQEWMAELGAAMWKLYGVKADIFSRRTSLEDRDRRLFGTLASYFRPDSEYRKI